ncbi:MAG: hypothetical protein KAW12_21630 [Candidatus Aminicenantes bacterium]|nr:hypothetical protein [Candidatus Aminicenantes bacterium]
MFVTSPWGGLPGISYWRYLKDYYIIIVYSISI